ncbi:MAG: HAD family hydrolase [Sphaerochaetaceae bacterium]|nr:HAD family hydrolase [Sphaerochaetaceae bacterium]
MIKAVMFDMGGTIEDLYTCERNEKATALALDKILKSHDITTPYGAEELWAIVGPQLLAYKKQSEKTMMELKPEEIWPDYAFKGIEVDRQKLIDCSEEIAAMWEVTNFDRKLRPHVKEMLEGLKELGLYVAAVSNTGSLFEVFDILKEYGIRQYFDDVTLSSLIGYRKPHPNIFKVAIAQSGFEPEECAFVGDTLSRDVVGPRKVGYGKVFKINSFLSPLKDIGKFDVAPDYEITDIYEVYEILKKELGK